MFYYPLAALMVVVSRVVIFGATIGDSIAVCGLSALLGFVFFLESKKQQPVNDSVKAEVEHLKNQIDGIKVSLAYRR